MKTATAPPGQRPGTHAIARQSELETLSPAYFAMAMATGIVSVAVEQAGMRLVARALLGLNAVAYMTLVALTILRVRRYPRLVLADLVDHQRGPGFFTIVAATGIFGSQSLRLIDNLPLAVAFWIAGLVLWIVLTYAVFTALIVKKDKPALADGISGAWLIAVVATQSIAVLSALLSAHVGQPYRVEMNFVALSMWLWGGMLYIWMISLIPVSLGRRRAMRVRCEWP